ncbi:MAG TPA: arylsulfatase [Acidimicrobiales bacterium]
MTPEGPFEGVIGRTVGESTPSWPARPHPGPDAPNVVVVLIDDLGFSHFGCYGSSIETPNIDRLAAGGLRYTNFHVTPLCSPTRAALLTGRNHHEVGMRSIANFNTGFPNMRGEISHGAATMAEVLRDEGYATFAVGKWHLCQMEDASAAGPFDQWPCQRGFDRYYGFLDGETDQFFPELTADNHRVEPWGGPADGYHLSEDLVDHAVSLIHDTTSVRPDRPFFLYLAFGATHAPHQAPAAYVDKYRGRFDDGWDVARDAWFARQLEMGLVPPGTQLAPRNPGVEPWDSLPENHRRLAARLQEAFAGFLEHTDAQIGRLVDSLDAIGQLDNTVVLLCSDNGASQEGGPFGVLHEMKYFNFIVETPDEAIERIDDIGGPRSHTNYPWGWAQAGNTPFKWYKQNTHEGGVHVPLVVHWPRGIDEAQRGTVRHQFHHVNDVAPTIYDLVGVEAPVVYRGVKQLAVTGTSMRYTLADPAAPSHKTVQYFEMMGHRAIWADGWKAVTRHTPGVAFDDDTWELYHVDVDRSECHDLAAAEPERLSELVALWWREADAHGVLPLDDRTVELFGAKFGEHAVHRLDRHYTYRPPVSPLPSQAGPAIGARSWDMDASIERHHGAQGVLFATGTENSGLSLFVLDDLLVFDYNFFGEHHVATSVVPVPVGRSVVGVRFRRDDASATATLHVDGEPCGVVAIPTVMRIISSVGASVGYDHGSAVSDRYDAPFAFEGRLERLDVQLLTRQPDDAAASEARAAMSRQ